MKLSIAAVSSFIAAAVAASLPQSFTLVADGGKTVVTDGTNAFIGGDINKYSILVLHGGSENSQLSYTAKGETPTGWQNLYAVEKGDQPIGLTPPHSASIPEGASTSGWGVNEKNQFTFNGKVTFGVEGENGVQKVYYLGAGNGHYHQAPLTIKEL